MKNFWSLIEARTKITSVFPFLMALAYLLSQGHAVRWPVTTLFFVSMLLFDVTATVLNNAADRFPDAAADPRGRKAALLFLSALLAASLTGSLALAFFTNIVVLLAGGACFTVGILYSAGPLPISRTPFGEAFSGIFYGFFIPFLLFSVNLPSFVTLSAEHGRLLLSADTALLLQVLLLSVIPTLATANIMLANNLCDLERDAAAGRHTLPLYLGRRRALALSALLYALCYAAVAGLAAARMVSPVCLLSLLTIFPVWKNIKAFAAVQDKETTFALSVRNYLWIMGPLTLLIFPGSLAGRF